MQRTTDSTRPARRTVLRLSALASLLGATTGLTACIQDPDCGICDPENLVLVMLSGINYQNASVYLLGPECEGDKCPGEITKGRYFLTDVGPCAESEPAEASQRGAEEYCRISPLITAGGLEFIFNNLLDPTSIELVRKRPDDPNLFEIYDWKTRILEIQGPITRFNGDFYYREGLVPDTVGRGVNLTCIENLTASGQLTGPFHEAVAADPGICESFQTVDGQIVPVRTQVDGIVKAYDGRSTPYGASCTNATSGADLCCTACDYLLSVHVAKYGVNSAGERRRPGLPESNAQGAIRCDATQNVYSECADFIPDVDRAGEDLQYRYDWNQNGEIEADEVFQIPRYDKLRETHPADRPPGMEQRALPCATDANCPEGAACVGFDSNGDPCDGAGGEECTDMRCQAEWFVMCAADAATTGAQAFCVDKRYRHTFTAACFVADAQFQACDTFGACQQASAGARFSYCDANANGGLTKEECCQESLGASADGAECDPVYDQEVSPIPRYNRDQTLPSQARDCFCGDPGGQPEECADQIEQYCAAPWGSGTFPEGQYTTKFIASAGGVIYDPAVKGFVYRPSDLGTQVRARVEACAETNNEIGGRSVIDGWRMGDNRQAFVESFEDFDRAMCSGSTYRIEFATAADGERVVDKVGNTLSGKSTYYFQTPQFHVQPGSGFPTQNLRVGGCDSFRLDFSNKYDIDPRNTKKIQLVALQLDASRDGCTDSSSDPLCWVPQPNGVVAGGINCAATSAEEEATNNPPCLTVDVAQQFLGQVSVSIDAVEFGKRLFEPSYDDEGMLEEDPISGLQRTGRYRFHVPGLGNYTSLEDAADALGGVNSPEFIQLYEQAFHDACGMPMITASVRTDVEVTDHIYDFRISEPKCKEDRDFDDVQLSCDNAPKHYNPDQSDYDRDGIGDVIDKCTTVPDPTKANTADSDKDGIGNECDSCRLQQNSYNTNAATLGIPFDLQVRNIPSIADFDQDGIGDVCDNCIVVANCQSFGPTADGLTPHTVGTPILHDNSNVCQQDDDLNLLGNACDGQQVLPDAAGPVGFGATDDLDQDGLDNTVDLCPRQPVERVVCSDDGDCPTSATCDQSGICNHVDSDNDGFGDICDTCAFISNPMQALDGAAQAADDQDGDFVGALCESTPKCAASLNPKPFAFFDVSANGYCCTTIYPGSGEYVMKDDGTWGCTGHCDPDGLPVKLDSTECPESLEVKPGEAGEPDGSACRVLPTWVRTTPGFLILPPGCEEALVDAGVTEATRVDPDTLGSDQAFWDFLCFMPQWDQDFDGIADECDLCPYAFDPSNAAYVDPNTGKKFEMNGAFCNGEYDIELICQAQDGGTGTTGTATGTGTGTGGETTGG